MGEDIREDHQCKGFRGRLQMEGPFGGRGVFGVVWLMRGDPPDLSSCEDGVHGESDQILSSRSRLGAIPLAVFEKVAAVLPALEEWREHHHGTRSERARADVGHLGEYANAG